MSSWDEMFRSFFNIPNNRRDPPSSDESCRKGYGFGEEDAYDAMDQDELDEFDDRDIGGAFGMPGFNFQFHFTEPDEMLKHFEEMFRDLGMAQCPTPSIGPTPENPRKFGSSLPRDHMLKETPDCPDCSPDGNEFGNQPPDKFERPSMFGNLWSMPKWNRIRPQDKIDQEIDPNDYTKDMMDEMFSGSKGETSSAIQRPPTSRNMFTSVSVKTIRKADGSVEHTRTVRGSDGKDETTVTRSHGDRSHSVITKQSPTGQEVVESYQNMDEKDLEDFNGRWSSERGSPPSSNLPQPPHDADKSQSIFKNIFGFSVPGFRST